MQVNRAIKNGLHSVLLRLSTCSEHASLCFEHRVAQSHLAGISFSCMPRHVTVGGFEPNQWLPHCANGWFQMLHANKDRDIVRLCYEHRVAQSRLQVF